MAASAPVFSPATEALAQAERITGLYTQARRARPIGWVLLLFVLGVFGPQAGVATSAAWALLMLLGLASAACFQHGFDAASASPNWQPEAWARRLRVGVVLSSLALGSAMWFFYREEQGNLRFLLLMVLLASAAGAIGAYGLDERTLQACLLSLAAPMLAWLLVHGLQRQAGVVGTLLLCFYFAMLMRFGRGHARLMADAIRLRHEQTALVQQLQQRRAEAEQARQATTDFFAAASHDLRQPVQALSFYAGLLGTPDEPPQLRQRLDGCVQALSHLFDGILGVAQLDAGKVVARPGPVRLQDVAQRLMPVYADAAMRRGLRLRWRIPAQAVVWSDALLLERMLGNLLANALRFTATGGVLVAARPRGGAWMLQVLDTGIGIAAADQQRIWQAFVQVPSPQRETDRGVGLGLPTVKRLADLLGHRIMLRSQPGRGTGFELLLPAARSLPEAPAPEQAAADRLAGRALVVDDDLPARSALALSLRHWGLVCDEAANAQQALAWAHGHVYDVVLCDHGLPGGVDGSALLAQLQALQPGTRLWAILSAASPPSPPAEGAPLWLTKPLRPVRLRALLQGALQAPAD